jgi:AcrR family transcriptional regulator
MNAKNARATVQGSEHFEPPPGRRERQRRRTLARIVRAARALFTRKGFEATTTQEIAAKADIGSGTLFNYAATKEDLLLLVFREEMDVVVAQAFATPPQEGPLLGRLLHVFDSFVAYHQRDVAIGCALMRQLSAVSNPETREDVRRFLRGLLGRIRELIEDAQRRGELRRDFSSAALAQNLFSIYYRLLQSWLGGYITYERYAASIAPALELQLRGLRREDPRPRGLTAQKTSVRTGTC